MPDVRLPDGTIVKNVPEGTTKAELLRKLGRDVTTREDVIASDPSEYDPQSEAFQEKYGANPSATERFARQAALVPRFLAEGANDVVSPFTSAVAYGANKGLEAAGADYRFPDQSQNFSNMLSDIGIPEPQGFSEKAGNVFGRMGTSMLAGNPLTNAVAGRLGINPAAQTISQRTPTVEELKRAANNAYQAVDNAGVVVAQSSFKGAVDDIAKSLADEGMDATLHPRITAAVARLSEDAVSDLPFSKVETLRKVLKSAASSTDPSERRLAMIAIDKMDDYIGKLGSKDVTGGDPNIASSMIKEARGLWSRSRKAEVIEDLFNGAKNRASNFTQSGMENALRSEFRSLAQNNKQMKLFSAEERAAIEKVARGGTLDNILRMVGKLAPTSVISGGISSGAGFAVGGPAGAVALPVTGAAARLGATNMTMNNANNALNMMLRGPTGSPQMPLVQQGSTTLSGLPFITNPLFNLVSEEDAKR